MLFRWHDECKPRVLVVRILYLGNCFDSFKNTVLYIHMDIYRTHNFCTTTTKLRHTAPVVTVLDKISYHGRFLMSLKVKWGG